MDNIILEAFPLLAAKQNGQLESAEKNGTRYIAAAHGLVREIKLPWIELRHTIAEVPDTIRLPYGKCANSLKFICGPIPGEPIREFIAHAREEFPNEVAGAILWNQYTGAWRYVRRQSLEANPGFIHFKEVGLEGGDCMVVDVHSHGVHPAFFSSQDDMDDFGTMRLSLVAGCLDKAVPGTCMRLNMAGYTAQVNRSVDGNIEAIKYG